MFFCFEYQGDFIINRDSQQTVRSVQAKGRENRKATTEDLDKALAKLQSQNDFLKETVDRGKTAQRLSAGKAAAMEDLEEGGVSGALSSVGRAAMNMGALEDVFMLEEEDNSDPDAAAEEQGVKRKEEDDDIVSEATARQAKKQRLAKAVWNQRDEKLIDEIDKHATWMRTTKKAFEDSLKEIQSIKKDIVGAAMPDLKQRIGPDLIQLENWGKAAKLVLAVEQPAIALKDDPASSDVTTDVKKSLEAGNETTDAAKNVEASAADDKNTDKGPEHTAEHRMRGKGPLELVKKSAADLRAMCANMEHPVANAPKTEDGGAQPCDDAKSTGGKSVSTVERFCNDSGGARKALQRYIAGFASRDTTVLEHSRRAPSTRACGC